MNALIVENQGLVHYHAKKFAAAHPLEDLVQEGNLGLLKAFEKFDPTKGKWGTYASWWIRAYLIKFVRRQPTVSANSGRPLSELPKLSVLSLDAPVYSDGDTTMLDGLEGHERPADEQLENHQFNQQVRDVIERLGLRLDGLPRAIIEQRLMRGATLDKVAVQFGVSRERVRQVEVKTRALLERHLAPIQEESHA
jgi:RNA polymerase primary sigma factor